MNNENMEFEKAFEDVDNDLMKELERVFEDIDGDIKLDSMDELSDNAIILNDENGDELKCDFLDIIKYENEEYVILLPIDEDVEAGEVIILKVENIESSEEEFYESVEDEEILQTVFEIFKDKFKDAFNFVD